MFVSLHLVVEHFVGSAHIVADYVLYYHILTIELLDNYIAVLRVWMYAAYIVVRDPYRIVAVLGVNYKVPRTGLVLIQCYCHLGVDKRGNLVDDSLGKLLIVFRPMAVKKQPRS